MSRLTKLQVALFIAINIGLAAGFFWCYTAYILLVLRYALIGIYFVYSSDDPLLSRYTFPEPSNLVNFLINGTFDLRIWTYNQLFAAEKAKNKLLSEGSNAESYADCY